MRRPEAYIEGPWRDQNGGKDESTPQDAVMGALTRNDLTDPETALAGAAAVACIVVLAILSAEAAHDLCTRRPEPGPESNYGGGLSQHPAGSS